MPLGGWDRGGSDSATPISVSCGAAPEGTKFAQAAERVGILRKRYWGQHMWARGYWVASSGNVTDEVWMEYIKNQVSPEPDDHFQVT